MSMKIPAPPKLPKVKLSDLAKHPYVAKVSDMSRPSGSPKQKIADVARSNLARLQQIAKQGKLPKLPSPANLPFLTRRASPPQARPVGGETPAGPPSTPALIWRALTKPVRLVNWRIVTAALFGVGILHIIATLAAPHLAIATAFNRLEGVLPANRILVLPEISPNAQPLPFLSPALRYAMCRFDTAGGIVDVAVELSVAGSSLTIYSTQGESIYTAAQSDIPVHRVRVVPDDGRFLGLTPEAMGRTGASIPSATLNAARGIVVYAVPRRGAAYQAATQALLDSAHCQTAAQM